MNNDLLTEKSVFDDKRGEWLDEHKGDFVLIKGDGIEGFFVTYADAFQYGLSKFGNEKFFIKEITEGDPTNYVFTIKI